MPGRPASKPRTNRLAHSERASTHHGSLRGVRAASSKRRAPSYGSRSRTTTSWSSIARRAGSGSSAIATGVGRLLTGVSASPDAASVRLCKRVWATNCVSRASGPGRRFMALFQVVIRHIGGDESRFGDYSVRTGPPRCDGQDLVGGTTIVMGGRDWLVTNASTHALAKFVCTPILAT